MCDVCHLSAYNQLVASSSSRIQEFTLKQVFGLQVQTKQLNRVVFANILTFGLVRKGGGQSPTLPILTSYLQLHLETREA